MAKRIKVTVGKAWYKDKVGEVFETYGEGTYLMTDGGYYYVDPEGSGVRKLVNKNNCVVVEEHTWHVGDSPRIFAHLSDRTVEIKGASDEDVERSSIDEGVQPGEAGSSDMVEHPSHYTTGKFEVIEIIEEVTKGYEDPFVGYNIGNVQKYIARAPYKGKLVEDLKKSRKYLDFAISHLEKKEA
jgi:hypothetical protein